MYHKKGWVRSFWKRFPKVHVITNKLEAKSRLDKNWYMYLFWLISSKLRVEKRLRKIHILMVYDNVRKNRLCCVYSMFWHMPSTFYTWSSNLLHVLYLAFWLLFGGHVLKNSCDMDDLKQSARHFTAQGLLPLLLLLHTRAFTQMYPPLMH